MICEHQLSLILFSRLTAVFVRCEQHSRQSTYLVCSGVLIGRAIGIRGCCCTAPQILELTVSLEDIPAMPSY